MISKKVSFRYLKTKGPKIGLIALSTDQIVEKDFLTILRNQHVNLFTNRIPAFNSLTKRNLIKMSKKITEVSHNILPHQKIDCMVYACTSGTITAGYESIASKIRSAKPNTKVVTPSSASINAFNKMKIKKISIFTPYSKKLNDEVVNFFIKNNFKVLSNYYLDIKSDKKIGQIDKKKLLKILSNLEYKNVDALFLSCTALPVLNMIEKLEKKIDKIVITSNQALIWDTFRSINKSMSIKGYGKLLR